MLRVSFVFVLLWLVFKIQGLITARQRLSLFSTAKHGVWLPGENVMSVKDDSCFEYRVSSEPVMARRSGSVRGNDTAAVLERAVE